MAAMDANKQKLDHRNDAVSQNKLLSDKDTTETRRRMGDESKYVKLDNSLNINPRKINRDVSSTAEECLQKSSSVTGLKAGDKILEREHRINQPHMVSKSNSHEKANECMTETLNLDLEPALLSELIQFNENVNSCLKLQEVCAERCNSGGDLLPQEETENTSNNIEDLQYTDMYLSRTNESDENVSLVLYDDYVPCITEDESHYITTHEIQLSELSDDEVDCDIGVGSSWDVEDDNQVYSFVDYASFGSDETTNDIGEKVKYKQCQFNCGAAVCRVLDSDLCAKSKCSSVCLGKCNGNSEEQIQLSIKTTSQTINEPSNIQEEENILHRARRAEDMSKYVIRGAEAKAEIFRDGAKCFIAAPGRLHFGRNLKGKDVNEYSSGASSAVSELDDADKEVRNLTARAFKSLAYPYFDAINFNTSSESSASEHGLGINRWSTFVDLKYGNMNMSQGGHNMMSQKRSTSSFTMAKNKDNKGYKGRASANIKLPPSNLFNLKRNSHNASASTKKIALMGKLGQGQSGVITLTETLNFHCNVKSGLSGRERRSKCAQTAAGSRSTDEVTNTLPGGQASEARKPRCNEGETMEDTHKKAIFASSLLKNVISKKMQFEQERKMERGEICEPNQGPSPCCLHQDPDYNKENGTLRESTELHRQSSKYSEASSDYSIVCVQELGEIVDSSSCDAKSESRSQDPPSLALDTNLESTNELGFDTKKGAFEAAKSTLLRSQNSAFRSWRDGGLEFQREHKNDKTLELKLPSATDHLDETDFYANSGNSKFTTMSHFFEPSIQPNGREVEKQLQTINYSTGTLSDKREGGDTRLRSDNTLYVADSPRTITAKSPDIKINLRNVKENKRDPFNISKLPIPNIVGNDANLIKTADDLRCHALTAVLKGESSDKVPHFMVRDVRDHKGKLQTPIHQVRDVRKLVKSSYHFVSLDKKDKSSPVGVNLHSEQRIQKQGVHRNRASVSPIMITCQSVNTNSNARHSENQIDVSKCRRNEDTFEIDRSSPDCTKTGMSLMHRPTGRVSSVNSARRDSSEVPSGLRIETPTAASKHQQTTDSFEKKTECPTANIAALEKLQAAVKTMEQLYVFDRNEWKRKSKTHHTHPDSHLLSLITNEGDGGPEEEGGNSVLTSNMDKLDRRDSFPSTDKTPLVMAASHNREIISNKEEKELPKTFYIPHSQEERMGPKLLSPQGGGKGNMYNLSFSQNNSVNTTASVNMNAAQVHVISQAPYSPAGFCKKSSKVPVSLNISQSRRLVEDMKRPNKSEAGKSATHDQFSISAEPENYLTVPFKSYASSTKQSTGSSHHKASVYTFNTTGAETQTGVSPPDYMSQQDDNRRRPTIIMGSQSQDTPTATIYHHALPMSMSTAQPQVICFSPTMGPLPTIEHFQATQRKMLLDPTTGNYYLVDTPVQPATKRLFDPETGQYIDVPLPQPPMTPLPMPISPLALSPGAYGHPYMMYPGFMSSPTVIPARTMHSQMSMNSEADDVNKGSHSQQNEGVYMESPYYMATGKSPKTHCLTKVRTPQSFINGKQPVNNMTSQQGPRIIAPPSFDGTTMSFVVEHG